MAEPTRKPEQLGPEDDLAIVDQLAAAVGENQRTRGEACPVFWDSFGAEPSEKSMQACQGWWGVRQNRIGKPQSAASALSLWQAGHNAVLPRRRGRFTAPLLLLMAVCLGPVPVAGHAIVVKTSLGDGPVKPDTPTTVVFSFSQKVQLPFTKVLLVNAGGEERSLKLAPGKRQGEVEAELPALPAGRYVLRYNVLGIDGHFTGGIVRFQVAAHQEK